MQVILKQDVETLGRRGDIVNVSNGYYRNYILPKGLGYKATKGAEAEAEAMRRASAAKNAESRADADQVASMLVPQVINITAKVHDEGLLFGSVGAADIVAAVEEQTGVVIDRKALRLDHAIKEVGTHMVMTRIHPEVEFPISVEISGEE
ncbi:MAG: 50S ribosomal protein L9 [Acidimicrobiales bacterium]|nr:50S ribosomal protein L9 [Acidimicrobiales bacterium]RZV43120.1 MAG: 50S ribosomal protein L9 [Acidimicrobiales bacterium]